MHQEDDSLMAPQIVESPAVPESWQRKRDESPRAYQAFQLYLHAEKRRLADVGAALIPACSAANVARWSTRHNWQTRAWAWDKEQDRIQQEQEARDRTAARKRHLAISQEMQALALRGLLELKVKAASGGALNMTPTEIENMLTQAVKLERLVLGVEKDRGKFSEFRIFIGTHYHPEEEGYGKPQEFKEWTPEPPIETDDDPRSDDDGGEPN
jgi:hypothetical protein